jgi:endonuclease/exonuclease/phosphatase family metal-dependent hydrolase
VAVVGDLNADPDSESLAPLLRGPLLDVLAGLPRQRRATFENGAFRSSLDYVMLNPTLALRMVPGSARVEDGPSVRAASDHRPVLVDLLLPAAVDAEGSPSQAREGGEP